MTVCTPLHSKNHDQSMNFSAQNEVNLSDFLRGMLQCASPCTDEHRFKAVFSVDMHFHESHVQLSSRPFSTFDSMVFHSLPGEVVEVSVPYPMSYVTDER